MLNPVYILIRTSRRPEYFRRCMESVRSQTYKNIITIVHTDDPRDTYVEGDIIVKGSCYGPEFGSAPYNLYCNTLLKNIPDTEGWYHFLDDDDIYASSDVIEKLVENSKPDHVNVAHVMRWDNKIFPDNWGKIDKGFQTECFFLHTDHKLKAKWWANKGGDGYYSKQLLKTLPVNWIENLLVCKAQTGKGHGRQSDLYGIEPECNLSPSDKVVVMALRPYRKGLKREWFMQGEKKWLDYTTAIMLEKEKIVKITYREK